jgi:hypothetical protein
LEGLPGRFHPTSNLRSFKLSKRDPNFDVVGPLQQAAVQGAHILTLPFRNFEVNVSFPEDLTEEEGGVRGEKERERERETSGMSRSLSEMAISKIPLALCVSPTLISS